MSIKVKKNTEITDLNFALLMALPVIFFLVFVVIYPLAYAFWRSLHKVTMFGGLKFKFIGFANFYKVLIKHLILSLKTLQQLVIDVNKKN